MFDAYEVAVRLRLKDEFSGVMGLLNKQLTEANTRAGELQTRLDKISRMLGAPAFSGGVEHGMVKTLKAANDEAAKYERTLHRLRELKLDHASREGGSAAHHGARHGTHHSTHHNTHADAHHNTHHSAHKSTHHDAHKNTHHGAHPGAHHSAHSGAHHSPHPAAHKAAHHGALTARAIHAGHGAGAHGVWGKVTDRIDQGIAVVKKSGEFIDKHQQAFATAGKVFKTLAGDKKDGPAKTAERVFEALADKKKTGSLVMAEHIYEALRPAGKQNGAFKHIDNAIALVKKSGEFIDKHHQAFATAGKVFKTLAGDKKDGPAKTAERVFEALSDKKKTGSLTMLEHIYDAFRPGKKKGGAAAAGGGAAHEAGSAETGSAHSAGNKKKAGRVMRNGSPFELVKKASDFLDNHQQVFANAGKLFKTLAGKKKDGPLKTAEHVFEALADKKKAGSLKTAERIYEALRPNGKENSGLFKTIDSAIGMVKKSGEFIDKHHKAFADAGKLFKTLAGKKKSGPLKTAERVFEALADKKKDGPLKMAERIYDALRPGGKGKGGLLKSAEGAFKSIMGGKKGGLLKSVEGGLESLLGGKKGGLLKSAEGVFKSIMGGKKGGLLKTVGGGLESLLGGNKGGLLKTVEGGLGKLASGAMKFLPGVAGKFLTSRALMSVASSANPVVKAAVTGYQVGGVLNEGISALISKTTGGKNTSLGDWLFDKLNPETPAEHDAKLMANIKPRQAAPVQVHTNIHMDGKKVAHAVSHHQAKAASRANAGQSRFDGSMNLRPAGAR